MKVLFTGDWQCTVANLDRCRAAVDQVMSLLKGWRGKNRATVFLGDAKDAFNPVDVRVSNFLIESMERIAEESMLLFIRGNHDSITTQDGVASLVPWMRSAASAVADQEFARATLGERTGIWMVPYLRDPARQRAEFQKAARDARAAKHLPVKILAFHNEVDGCQRSAHMTGTGLTESDIDAAAYLLCASGHIHRPHRAGRVWFAGSPFACDWGECNEEKRFLVADVDEKKKTVRVSSIPSEIPNWYDPARPGYAPPRSFRGTHFRFAVPVGASPAKELAEARKRLEAKYSGAILHIKPEFPVSTTPSRVDVKGTDAELLKKYFDGVALLAGTAEQAVAYLSRHLGGSLFGVQGLEFLSVEAENVLSFEKVSLKLDRKGMTLVTGVNRDWSETISNGAGKSSLVTLPFLGLTGRTFKDQTDDAWACRKNKARAWVDVSVRLPDGRKLRVYRQRRPGIVRAWLDAEEISMGDKAATTRAIESLTNLTWEVLTNSVYIGQREIGSVFGTEKERKELFSKLLGLDRFLVAQKRVREDLSRVRGYVEEIDAEISSATAARDSAADGIASVRAALAEAGPDEDVSSKKSEADALKKEIAREEEFIASARPDLEANQKAFEEFLFEGLDAEATMRSLQERIDAASAVGARCETCGAKSDPISLRNHVAALRSRYSAAKKICEESEHKQGENRTARASAMKLVGAANAAADAARKKLVVLEKEIEKAAAVADARARLSRHLIDAEAKVSRLARAVSIHQRARDSWADDARFLTACADAVGRDGLPAYLCALAAPALNAAAASYSDVFTGSEIGVEFQMGGGDIDLSVRNLHGGDGAKDQSEGELRLAAYVAAFAFRDVLVRHNVLVLDEPGAGLDPANAEIFAKELNKIVERFGHVFVISHNERILAALEPRHRIEVTKENGIAVAREL